MASLYRTGCGPWRAVAGLQVEVVSCQLSATGRSGWATRSVEPVGRAASAYAVPVQYTARVVTSGQGWTKTGQPLVAFATRPPGINYFQLPGTGTRVLVRVYGTCTRYLVTVLVPVQFCDGEKTKDLYRVIP